MYCDKTGRQILKERPILNSQVLDLEKLKELPLGTFGREYVNTLDTFEISPDTRTPVIFNFILFLFIYFFFFTFLIFFFFFFL